MTPSPDPCRACGRVPAETFAIRRHVGMLVVQRFVKVQVPLCRDHALEITKQYTLKTLWQGWWGYISFFVNWFVLFSNLTILSKARRMPAPVAQPPGQDVTPEPVVDAAVD